MSNTICETATTNDFNIEIKKEYESDESDPEDFNIQEAIASAINAIKDEPDDLHVKDYREYNVSIEDIIGVGVKTELYSPEDVGDENIVIGNTTVYAKEELVEEDGELHNQIDEIYPGNEFLTCKSCGIVYKWFCSKCRMITHILNKNVPYNIANRTRKSCPKNFLRVKRTLCGLSVFTRVPIPKGVKFGPFEGLNSIKTMHGSVWKINNGRLYDIKDKNSLNWLQYVQSTEHMHERNLSIFQCEDGLYFRSVRDIRADEELLVYFYEQRVMKVYTSTKMDILPIVEKGIENVFACTYCCLGFSSEAHLRQHKITCEHGLDNMEDSLEEIVQCAFCKIYLDELEYSNHHMTQCCAKNSRAAILPEDVEARITVANVRETYACPKCNFSTHYKQSLTRHDIVHTKEKLYFCALCNYKVNDKRPLAVHIKKAHYKNAPKEYKCRACSYEAYTHDYLRHHISRRHPYLIKKYKCPHCPYVGLKSIHLIKHKAKHNKKRKYTKNSVIISVTRPVFSRKESAAKTKGVYW